MNIAVRYVYALVVATISKYSECSAVIVNTNVGKIAGNTLSIVADGKSKTITSFTNIPFAETTAGMNRFLKPIPKAPFKGTFQANGNPIGCIQSSAEATHRLSPFSNFSEDCLILNIFVPHDFTRNSSLPVMVWIYGGAFAEGASGLYPPEVLVAYTDVIVVTLNYRVGMFGFLQSSDGKLPGNQGLWDQHLAIKWVHENIAPFTGNQNQITIFGQSAGGASVLYQALYPGNQGYFQRVIAESGSPLANWAMLNRPNAEMYYKKIGCDSSSDPISCLRSKTPEQLQVPRIANDPLEFYPSVDNDFVPEAVEDILFGNTSNPKSAAAREFYTTLDVVCGVNNFDGGLYMIAIWPSLVGYTDINNPRITRDQLDNIVFGDTVDSVLKPMNNETREMLKRLVTDKYTDWNNPDSFLSTRTSALNISNDVEFFSPAIRATQAHVTADGGKTYFYEFSFTPAKHALPTPSWIHGANHGDEIYLVLAYPLNNSTSYADEDKYVSRAMTTMWTNFAKSGDPNIPVDVNKYIHTTWPEYNMTSQYYFEISDHMWITSVKQRFQDKRMEFWSELIPKINKNIK